MNEKTLKTGLKAVGDSVSATPANRKNWALAAVQAPKPVYWKRRLLLVAAVVAVSAALAGFGYLVSHFDDIFYVIPDVGPRKQAVQVSQDEEQTGETQAADGQADDIQMDEAQTYAYMELDSTAVQAIMKGTQAGELLKTTVTVDGAPVEFRAVCAERHYMVWYRPENEGWLAQVYPHSGDEMPPIQGGDVEDYIRRGDFVATLEGGGFEPARIFPGNRIGSGSNTRFIYSHADGYQVSIVLSDGTPTLMESEVEASVIEEMTIDGISYLYIERGGDDITQPRLYRYMGENSFFNTIQLHGDGATKTQLLEAAKHLVLHNSAANTLPVLDESYFQTFNDPVIRQSAAEIAAAVREAENKMPGLPYTDYSYILWQKDGRTLRIPQPLKEESHIRRYLLQYDELDYDTIAAVSPIPVSFLSKTAWFPRDRITKANFVFEGGRAASGMIANDDHTVSIVFDMPGRVAGSTYQGSPLETLLYGESYAVIPEYLVKDSSGQYLLIGTAERDDTGETILIRSVVTENGVNAVHTLSMPRSALPAPLEEWAAKEFA